MDESEHWNLQPDGNIYLPHVHGFRVAGMGDYIGLQLTVGFLSGKPPVETKSSFQGALTTSAAREIANVLLAAADKLDRQTAGKA